MSDFPSIDDLGGVKNPPMGKGSVLQVSSKETAGKLSKKISQIKFKEKEVEAMRFAQSIGYPHIDLEKFPITQEALRQISLEDAKRLRAVCFFVNAEELRVGAIDPRQEGVADLVNTLTERTYTNSQVYVISQKSFDHVIDSYKNLPIVKPLTKDIEIKETDLEKVQVSVNSLSSLQSLLDKTSTTDNLISILGAAFKLDASDVHIEAEAERVVVRLRLDGILHDAANLPKEMYRQIVSRIKLVSSLKINITDKPQDGRFTIKLKSGEVDVRVSSIPTVYGESIVMRLLHQSREGLTLDKLGLSKDAYEILKREIERPNGMIITTGPTGSGKTTTLYAIMNILNQPDVKIITLEDPVEYKMAGVNQSQIDASSGYTFAKGLRSMLRQDPDVAMVGEIRDLETAEIAVQAALTGHLILSTIHTNNAAGAIPRFLSMGLKPFLLAPSLNCVMGQRLVRKLCQKCKVPVTLKSSEQERVDKIISDLPEKYRTQIASQEKVFYSNKGCEACGGIGYKGRVGIYEIFVVNSEIEKSILEGEASQYTVENLTKTAGMVTMVQDGILKALAGETSVDEVFRVIE